MEVKARYLLIGLFTIAVIGLGFGFVYWLHSGGGLGQRAVYRIRYDGTVSGLIKGSAVLFNGIRVGEVSALSLDPKNPTQVMVDIAIQTEAPVRADTHVGIDFQGLTGAPIVTLAGGSAHLPLLSRTSGTIPVLHAEKNAGQGMTQAARDLLRNIDRVVNENATPLRNLIANADQFAAALARNSDRVDSLMSGLERLTGGGTKPLAKVYDLSPARQFPAINRLPTAQLLVAEATTLSLFDTDKIVINGSGAEIKPVIDQAQWPDLLPKVIQARLIQSFENATYAGAIGRAPDGAKTEFQLSIDIRKFGVSAEAGADVELAAKLFNSDGRMVGTRVFRSSSPITSLEAAAATAGLSKSFEHVAAEIVAWTLLAMP